MFSTYKFTLHRIDSLPLHSTVTNTWMKNIANSIFSRRSIVVYLQFTSQSQLPYHGFYTKYPLLYAHVCLRITKVMKFRWKLKWKEKLHASKKKWQSMSLKCTQTIALGYTYMQRERKCGTFVEHFFCFSSAFQLNWFW